MLNSSGLIGVLKRLGIYRPLAWLLDRLNLRRPVARHLMRWDFMLRLAGDTAARNMYLQDKRFYRPFAKKGMLCFDIGANAGRKTRSFLKLGCRVVAVEPNLQCYRLLTRRYAYEDRLTVIHAALGARPGSATISVCHQASVLSTMYGPFIEQYRQSGASHLEWSEQQVEVTTLDELIRTYGLPDFCKIDVEGFEWEVFQGLGQPIGMLSFEFHPRHLDIAQRCIDYLEHLGSYRYNYTAMLPGQPDSVYRLVLPQWVDAAACKEALLNQACSWGDVYARLCENPGADDG